MVHSVKELRQVNIHHFTMPWLQGKRNFPDGLMRASMRTKTITTKTENLFIVALLYLANRMANHSIHYGRNTQLILSPISLWDLHFLYCLGSVVSSHQQWDHLFNFSEKPISKFRYVLSIVSGTPLVHSNLAKRLHDILGETYAPSNDWFGYVSPRRWIANADLTWPESENYTDILLLNRA